VAFDGVLTYNWLITSQNALPTVQCDPSSSIAKTGQNIVTVIIRQLMFGLNQQLLMK